MFHQDPIVSIDNMSICETIRETENPESVYFNICMLHQDTTASIDDMSICETENPESVYFNNNVFH